MRKMMQYRLYPTDAQTEALDEQLGEACRLYNAALQERRDAYQRGGVSLNYYDQANQLKDIRSAGALGLANFSASQDILRRVDKTFKAFFRRVKAGAARPGYPRFKSRRRFDSYTFPRWGDGCRLTDAGRLYLQGVGHLKVKWHRPLEGTVKTVTVKRQAGKWFVCFSVEYVADAVPGRDARVGIDVGLTDFATLSTGETIANPRHYWKAQGQLRIAQRRVARRKRGGRNRRKAVQVLQKAHAHVQNQRADFHHKTSRTLVDTYGVIAVEDLNVKGLASGMLAKSVNDVGWSAFISQLAYKAAEAGRQLVYVNPRGTSQTCLCGAPVPKTLSQRWHECVECGLSAARDHVSAQRILGLGLSLLGVT
jgi:putative transposase